MEFNFSYAKGVSLDQIKGFELAGKIWSTFLKDDVTIKIAIDLQKDFPGNAIAGAAPRLNTQKFDAFQKSLQDDVTSLNDWTAIHSSSLSDKSFTGRFNDSANGNGNGNNGNSGSESRESTQLNVTSANAKALDLALKGSSSILDGYIVMRDFKAEGRVKWDYDFARTAPAPAKTLDFLSVAIHEIGHILGFQSSVDRPDIASSDYNKNLDERVKSTTPLDLFRYSDKSKRMVDAKGKLTSGVDLAIGGNPFFSVQSGNSVVAAFDTGTDKSKGGSGNQASHWKSGGIMNAVLSQGSRPTVTSADLMALDVIGYNVSTQNSPNYATLLQEVTQTLAQRMGKTTSWLQANPNADISQLTEDVIDATSEMLDNSSVYKKKDSTFWTNGGRGGQWWQGFKQTFLEEGLFETLGNDQHSDSCQCSLHKSISDDRLFSLSGETFDSLSQFSESEPFNTLPSGTSSQNSIDPLTGTANGQTLNSATDDFLVANLEVKPNKLVLKQQDFEVNNKVQPVLVGNSQTFLGSNSFIPPSGISQNFNILTGTTQFDFNYAPGLSAEGVNFN